MRVEPSPTIQDLIEKLEPAQAVQALSTPTTTPAKHPYPHWDKLRRLQPPGELSSEQWWLQIKFGRTSSLRTIPLTDADGNAFGYGLPDIVLQLLHHIDQRCREEIAMAEVVAADEQARKRYLVNSLMEEAIRSSQLEGATTTRRVAKELLRTGRSPKDRSERMILNNYRALQFMRELGDEIDPDAVLELHRILTNETLDNPDAAGRLQQADEERIVVVDSADDGILHRPPPAEQLPARLASMCDFANANEDDPPFIHPVVRGIVLHFWLAFDHPFEDGNGRTARALFYWYMRTRGYWLVEYLSISRVLRKAPAQYGRAFLETETDENDLTYFLIHQLRVMEQSIDELHIYLRRKMADIREVEALVKDAEALNGRQLALITDAVRHGDRTYSFNGHSSSHGVTHETARSDLTELAELGLLERRRVGRQYLFTSPTDLTSRLKSLE